MKEYPKENLSGSAVRACNNANAKLVARLGAERRDSLAELAREMNDHVDIMNGAYGRNKVKVKKRIDIVKSCITSADSVHLVRILEILDGSMTGGVTWSFFLTGRIASKTRFSRERLGSTCWYRFWVSFPCVAISSRTSRVCKRATVDEAPSLEILARFGNIRASQGNHENHKKEQAYVAGLKADQIRNAQQSKRRNTNRGDVSYSLDLNGTAARALLPVTAKERKHLM